MQQCISTLPPSISPGERFLSRSATSAYTFLYNGAASGSNPRKLYLESPPNYRIYPHSCERPAPDLHRALVLTRTGLRFRPGVGAHIGYSVNSWVVMREGGVGSGGSDRRGTGGTDREGLGTGRIALKNSMVCIGEWGGYWRSTS